MAGISIRLDLISATDWCNKPFLLNFLGGFISRVCFSSHLYLTPKAKNTSSILFTSSILGMPCRTVIPLFKREAHKSPMAPFLEGLVFMEPLSLRPPEILKSIESLRETILCSRASPILRSSPAVMF